MFPCKKIKVLFNIFCDLFQDTTLSSFLQNKPTSQHQYDLVWSKDIQTTSNSKVCVVIVVSKYLCLKNMYLDKKFC